MMKVSVCMITYGHEKFIEEAIKGVLFQNCSFEVELIVADDCSKDDTHDIVKKIIESHPNGHWIKYTKHPVNLGLMQNFMWVLQQCKGKYISLCEGDDYWTDPLKLQKQVDFLEKNSDFSLCFHNAYRLNSRGSNQTRSIMHEQLGKDVFTTSDLLKQYFIPTASIVYRNYIDFEFPSWFQNCASGDIPLMLLLSLEGKFKYLDEIMSCYRLHDAGISTTHSGYYKVFSMIYIYQNFNIHTNFKFASKIEEAMIYEIRKHLPEVKELNHLKIQLARRKGSIKNRIKGMIKNILNLR